MKSKLARESGAGAQPWLHAGAAPHGEMGRSPTEPGKYPSMKRRWGGWGHMVWPPSAASQPEGESPSTWGSACGTPRFLGTWNTHARARGTSAGSHDPPRVVSEDDEASRRESSGRHSCHNLRADAPFPPSARCQHQISIACAGIRPVAPCQYRHQRLLRSTHRQASSAAHETR